MHLYPQAAPSPRMPVPPRPIQQPYSPNQPPALPPGTILFNRYLIQGYIGGGGFGHIYKALDNALGYRRAIKEAFYQDPQTRHQFHLEAEFLLNARHPNLVRGYAVFEQMSRLYLVMDYVDGHTLEEIAIDHIRRTGRPLPEARILDWMLPICDAAHALHSCPVPVIHRDVKPANVKVNRQGIPILIDLGLAKLFARGTQTIGAALAFTPGYAPPEQYQAAGTTDGRTDVYGLGASLFYLLTGYQPTEAPARLGNLTVPPLTYLNPAISQPTVAAVLRAMELDPMRRQQSALELEHELRAARAALGPTEYGDGRPISHPGAAPLVCARCGSANPSVAQYCMRCGVPLTSSQTPQRQVTGTNPLDAVELLAGRPAGAVKPPATDSAVDAALLVGQAAERDDSIALPPAASAADQPADALTLASAAATSHPEESSDPAPLAAEAPAADVVSAGRATSLTWIDAPPVSEVAATSVPPAGPAAEALSATLAAEEPVGNAQLAFAVPASAVSQPAAAPPDAPDLTIDQPAIAMPPLRRGPVPDAMPLGAASSPGRVAAHPAHPLWHPGVSPRPASPPASAPPAVVQAAAVRQPPIAAGVAALWLKALPSIQRWHVETLSATAPLDEMEVRSGVAALLALVLAVSALVAIQHSLALAAVLPAAALAYWCLYARTAQPTQEARWLATMALVVSYTWLVLYLVGVLIMGWPTHF